MRTLYMPLRPDLDELLFATVGEERDGMSLSVISALTGLGLDPWAEATRLSSLEKGEAIKQLVLMITGLPGERWASSEVRKIALGLIERLPPTSGAVAVADIGRQAGAGIPPEKMFWLVCFLLTAAALGIMLADGGLPVGSQRHSTPVSQSEPPSLRD